MAQCICSCTYSSTQSLTCLPARSLTLCLTHSLTHSLSHSLTHSLSHSLVCRVSRYAKVRFFTCTDREDLYVAAIQHFLGVDARGIIRLAVCKLIPAKYGDCEDILTADLVSSMQQVQAMDMANPLRIEGVCLVGL